ncbi:PREDICTED: uncharacterized protein LOC109184864 [Ipomoea nil]|uniref:uncharacterized protein LOC109184864 n=1 Tax=Ipomoea nil TaxID=35883 RepID=UPI000900C20F|nr:PREDICTED: uncharacterized protein LOC109184864 [Ipomoea nil]
MATSTPLSTTANAVYCSKSNPRSYRGLNSSFCSLGISVNLRLPLLISTRRNVQLNQTKSKSDQPDVSPPTGSSSNPLKGWIVGILLSICLPTFHNKWAPLMQLKNNVDNIVETVEEIADGVEKAAKLVDRVSEVIVDDLPPGELRNAVKSVQNMAEKIDKNAEALGNMIDKVQQIEDMIEERIETS